MIRRLSEEDFESVFAIINEAAEAYRGVIPPDRWKVPYMSRDELRHEMDEGVIFWGYEESGDLLGVMGLQDVQDVALIRHAYVRRGKQRQGVGGALVSFLRGQTDRCLLVGTWADASWAVRFYEKHGFSLVSPEEKNRLLKKYWTVPERQIETSVVLAEKRWFEGRQEGLEGA
jgi:GNAT superfamily N-acetyltransferase